MDRKIVNWLLEGDVAIQYQTKKYLLGNDDVQLRARIATEGFGKRLLDARNPDTGHWGQYYYQPKWTCTHYTLLDLRNLEIDPHCPAAQEMILRMLEECMAKDGGINLAKSDLPSDICVDGMILNYASFFCPQEPRLPKLVDFLLPQQRTDGGFTWHADRNESDPDTTICVLEGLEQFQKAQPGHRDVAVQDAKTRARTYLLNQILFAEIKDYTKLIYPYRYHYSVLRALEYLANAGVPYNSFLAAAFASLQERQKPDGKWILNDSYPGAVHFEMEREKQPSRWITLKAMHVFEHYK